MTSPIRTCFRSPEGRNVEHPDPDRDDVAIGFASGRIDQESDSGILEVIGPIDPPQLGAAREARASTKLDTARPLTA